MAIIVTDMTGFMVLSSWHSHCESLPGSYDECSTLPVIIIIIIIIINRLGLLIA